jgi:hypothetical protein
MNRQIDGPRQARTVWACASFRRRTLPVVRRPQVSGRSLVKFFEQWFHTAGFPEVRPR